MQGSLFEHGTAKGAILSDCKAYRYRLWRTWEPGSPTCNFLMLNPSTANAVDDDPTATKCIGYAKRWGYGGLAITNLFALRSTDPSALRSSPDPVGRYNDLHILTEAGSSAIVVAAWGAHPGIEGRVCYVRKILADAGVVLHCLALTKGGHPGHPLFLNGNLRPTPFGESRATR